MSVLGKSKKQDLLLCTDRHFISFKLELAEAPYTKGDSLKPSQDFNYK